MILTLHVERALRGHLPLTRLGLHRRSRRVLLLALQNHRLLVLSDRIRLHIQRIHRQKLPLLLQNWHDRLVLLALRLNPVLTNLNRWLILAIKSVYLQFATLVQ